MGTENQNDERKQEDTKPAGQTAKDEEAGNDFLAKMFESFGQDDDRKNIYVQYRIINNHGVMASDNAQIEKVYADGQEALKGVEKKAKRNLFSDENRRNKWLAENYETYPMALMIAVAVFNAMPYTWVMRAADALYESFENKRDKEEKRYGITEILSQFGAVICRGELNTYTGITPVDIVRLDKKTLRETILKYVWVECPRLQDVIMRWLEKQYMGKTISMKKIAGEVMGRLACWDYNYFLNNMVNQIRRKNSNQTDMMIAQVIGELDKDEELHKNVDKLLENWSRESNIHYLFTDLFVCVERQDKNDILERIVSNYIDRSMEELQREESGEYLAGLFDFFAAGMRAFTFYRILIEKIYGLAYGNSSPRNMRNVRNLFWMLFDKDIRSAQLEKGENAVLIRLVMQEDSVGRQLRCLWQMQWRDRNDRKRFYSFLAKYHKRAMQIPGYSLEKFIQKAFVDIDEETQMDICTKIRRRIGDE